MKNLKPVVVVESRNNKNYGENIHAQHVLLKALSDGITDINELRKLAGLKAAADVYRTLDKMAIRKEYHAALDRGGLSLDYLVNNLKGIIDSSDKDDNKIKAISLLMKSIGLDKYEKQEDMGKSWEEVLLQTVDKKPELSATDDYEVIAPVKSEARQKQKEEEEEIGEQLYGN